MRSRDNVVRESKLIDDIDHAAGMDQPHGNVGDIIRQLMEPRLAAKQYRDTYMELSGTVTPDTKIFVQDMGEPGLSSKKQENMYDTWTRAGKVVMFDGENDKQKISDADYAKMFAAADEEYARILGALLAEAKK